MTPDPSSFPSYETPAIYKKPMDPDAVPYTGKDVPGMTPILDDPELQEKILKHYSKTKALGQCAQLVGVCSGTIRRYIKSNPDFAARWEDAGLFYLETLEEELHRRAVTGIEETVVRDGKEYTRVKYSDALLKLQLQRHDRRYRTQLPPEPPKQEDEVKQLDVSGWTQESRDGMRAIMKRELARLESIGAEEAEIEPVSTPGQTSEGRHDNSQRADTNSAE